MSSVSPAYSIPPQTFSQQDFMNLIVTELKNQDPMQATDPEKMMESFMALANYQAAQSASLATQNLQTQVTNLQKLDSQSLALYLEGKQATFSNGSGGTVSGTVSQVLTNANGANAIINGQSFPIQNLVSVP